MCEFIGIERIQQLVNRRGVARFIEELAEEIREYAGANPGMSHQTIAEKFGVNHGRVSEAIKGKRT